ncbi:MAG: hypothetical protein CUN55_02560 [Phototrophicales bacterium]|nr:MAG: hypothetical protein CUN55_02560 [Phototrophicales bacterium]
MIDSKPHYPLTMRILIELYNNGELPTVRQVLIEPRYGYVARLVYADGGIRMLRRTNVGINNHGACEISSDKGYTKFFLQHLGYNVPRGTVFLMKKYRDLIDSNLSRYGFSDYNEAHQMLDYIEHELGFPVFIKPNEESQGKGVYKCYDARDVSAAHLAAVERGEDKLLVEEAVPYPDYRVVVLDGEMICAYQRVPLRVVGDGQHSIRDLLFARQQMFNTQGREVTINLNDARLRRVLKRHGYALDDVLGVGIELAVMDISNLSAGGDAQDVSTIIHPHWRDLCIRLTQEMGLRFCGVDLACADITDSTSAYSIIETNASPGLDHYAALHPDHLKVVRAMYQRIFLTSPLA